MVFANRAAQDTNNGRGLEPFVRYVRRKCVCHPLSLPSAPRTLMRTPPDPPAAPPAGNIQVTRTARTDGGIDLGIEVTDPPIVHAKAISPYQLAVWPQWPGQAILPVTNQDYRADLQIGMPAGGMSLTLSTGTIAVTVPPPDAPGTAANPVTLRLGYVDPADRLGELTTITVP